LISYLILSKFIDLAVFGSCSSAQLMFITKLLAIFMARPGWPWLGLAHLGCDTSGNIVAQGRLDVCDGAHWTFVMKKGWNLAYPRVAESPSSRSLDERGTRPRVLSVNA
jgi:hypothetical protein